MLKQPLRTCTIQGNADGSTAVDYTVNCATGYPAVTGGATLAGDGGSARAAIRPAPLLGADTNEALHQVLGLDRGVIGRLRDAGVVAGPDRDPTVASRP